MQACDAVMLNMSLDIFEILYALRKVHGLISLEHVGCSVPSSPNLLKETDPIPSVPGHDQLSVTGSMRAFWVLLGILEYSEVLRQSVSKLEMPR